MRILAIEAFCGSPSAKIDFKPTNIIPLTERHVASYPCEYTHVTTLGVTHKRVSWRMYLYTDIFGEKRSLMSHDVSPGIVRLIELWQSPFVGHYVSPIIKIISPNLCYFHEASSTWRTLEANHSVRQVVVQRPPLNKFELFELFPALVAFGLPSGKRIQWVTRPTMRRVQFTTSILITSQEASALLLRIHHGVLLMRLINFFIQGWQPDQASEERSLWTHREKGLHLIGMHGNRNMLLNSCVPIEINSVQLPSSLSRGIVGRNAALKLSKDIIVSFHSRFAAANCHDNIVTEPT